MRLLLILALAVTSCEGYRHFQEEIPHGDNVPHPCKPNFIWRGVAHFNVLGGGRLNPFGEDFKKVKKWTKELCEKDSDGDGMTNGQELGDPDCIWVKGSFPFRNKNITHPGVCHPWGSEQCREKNVWVSCDAGGVFKCDALKDPDVKNVTIRYPPTKVPKDMTSYMCMTFDLPQEEDYHLIASMPVIDNENVMHHIVLYGCSDDVNTTSEPNLCYMSQRGCEDVIGIWTLGMTGECVYKDAGFYIGKNGIKKAAMQFHWTNPEKREDFVDSSGLKLFYTSKLRKYNAGTFLTGQTYLNIPPGQQRVEQVSTCTPKCTNSIFKGPVHLTSGLNHMHYLGVEQNVELFRGDRKVTDLADDPLYSYDTPIVHEYKTPIVMMPGDSLKTTCVYRSTSKDTVTYYGEGSFEEMCFGIFTIFPKENLTDNCATWKEVETCNFVENHADCATDYILNFRQNRTIQMAKRVIEVCTPLGSCDSACRKEIDEIKKHPCFDDEGLGEYLIYIQTMAKDKLRNDFATAFQACWDTSGTTAPTLASYLLAIATLAVVIPLFK